MLPLQRVYPFQLENLQLAHFQKDFVVLDLRFVEYVEIGKIVE